MKSMIRVVALVLAAALAAAPAPAATLDEAAVADRIRGAWMGKMAGVAWGAPTEFHYYGLVPDAAVPAWQPSMINNAFNEDDLYVQIPFLQAMQAKGVNCSWTDFGEAFSQTTFPLWHANRYARENLQAGIAAPYSGHYSNTDHGDDIDWQIESDFAGLVNPGQVSAAMDVAWRGGHVMNYGDGVYGGVVVAAMNSRAFTATTFAQVVQAGRDAVPAGSLYRQAVDDVFASYQSGKTWQEARTLINQKYGPYSANAYHICMPGANGFDIDAKLNGAFVFIGLLYGQNIDGTVDMERAMRIAMQCGQDSDCNPATVGSIVGAFLGQSGIPEKFTSALSTTAVFRGTAVTFESLTAMTLDLARQSLLMTGGSVQAHEGGQAWQVPDRPAGPILYEQWPRVANDAPSLTAGVSLLPGGALRCDASATDSDGVREYQWFFGDLSFASGPAVDHVYALAGTYEVICYVADATGNTTWRSFIVTAPAGLRAGDANGDRRIDDDDLSLLLANWGGAGWGKGDFDESGNIDDDDLSLLLSNWSGAGGTIPEPATIGLLIIGGIALARRNQRRQPGR